MDEYYFYVVKCKDGSLYAGTTNNVEKRIKAHNEGKGAKYTRAHRPVKLIYQETFPSKGMALSFELKFKKFSRAKKEKYICNFSKNMDNDS